MQIALDGRAFVYVELSSFPQTSLFISLLCVSLRYIHALYLGAQSRWHSNSSRPRRHFHWRLMFESADITMLRLLEAFLKSAPQLVLQLSIMIHGNNVLPLQGQAPTLRGQTGRDVSRFCTFRLLNSTSLTVTFEMSKEKKMQIRFGFH